MKTRWYSSKTFRLCLMLTLTFTYFLIELIVGHITKSVALMADAYHMLSDVLALIIALVAVRISRRLSNKNTYGWVRGEVVGANINAVFLLALCLTIIIDAIERFVNPEPIRNPTLLLIVGSVGLGISIIGLFLFQGFHGHSHGARSGDSHGNKDTDDHFHSHTDSNGHLHHHEEACNKSQQSTSEEGIAVIVMEKKANTNELTSHSSCALEKVISVDMSQEEASRVHQHTSTTKAKAKSSLNMHGVFLHVLADGLGSLAVIISSLLIKLVPHDSGNEKHWTMYIDPTLSTLIVIVISLSTIPLLKETSLILLQSLPVHIRADQIKEQLLDQILEIDSIHDLHIWRLTGEKVIASAHLRLRWSIDPMNIALKVKRFFHSIGIHSTTIQFEHSTYDQLQQGSNDSDENYLECLVRCTDDVCDRQTCCNKDLIAANAMYSRRTGLQPRRILDKQQML